MSRIANRPVSAADAAPASAPDAMSEHLDSPPALMEAALRGGTRLTRRWRHGELHDTLPAMSDHVIMTFYGASQEASWRQGARRLTGRTRPGAVTVIPEGQDGRWDIEAPIEVSHVYLPDERLQSLAEMAGKGQRIELVSRICFDDAAGARILELLGHEAGNGDPASSLFVEQAVELLCMQLVRAHSSLGARERQAPRRGLADWQVRKVTGFMREFLDREILLDELAGLVNLSRFHFCTAFRQATGQTPHEWLTALRIGRSRQLLANPEMPITGIALAVGYQTPSSFSASFRKVTGMSPSAFRRSL